MSDVIATIVILAIVGFRAFGWWIVKRERATSFAIAQGRVCPKCGRPTRAIQMVPVTFEDVGVESSRAINRCSCGEWTMFDAAGGARHVDPPGPPPGARVPSHPAIGVPVRILCGALGIAFVMLALWGARARDPLAALIPLAAAFLFLGIALFASGVPHNAPPDWARVRHQRVRRIQLSLAAIGVLGVGVLHVLDRFGASEHWTSMTRLIAGPCIGLAMFMEYVVAYYGHYDDPPGD